MKGRVVVMSVGNYVFFSRKAAYVVLRSRGGSEMGIRDRTSMDARRKKASSEQGFAGAMPRCASDAATSWSIWLAGTDQASASNGVTVSADAMVADSTISGAATTRGSLIGSRSGQGNEYQAEDLTPCAAKLGDEDAGPRVQTDGGEWRVERGGAAAAP